MRRKRKNRSAKRHCKETQPNSREIVLPGLASLQEKEEQEAAWFDDPSYADRMIDKEAFLEVEAYRKEGMCP